MTGLQIPRIHTLTYLVACWEGHHRLSALIEHCMFPELVYLLDGRYYTQ